MFKGSFHFLKLCWQFDKYYILLLILKSIINTIMTLSIIILPKYIIDSLFVTYDYQLSIVYIIGILLISFISNIVINYITNISMIRKMIVFKKFQLYLSEVTMNISYYKMENAEYLNTREKAYKYLYGNGNGFAQVLESSFALFGNILNLSGIIVIICTLNFSLIFFLVLIIIINSIVDAKTKKKNIKLSLEKAKFERRGMYFSNIVSDFRYGKEIRAYNISKWLLKKYEYQLDLMQEFYKKISKNNIQVTNITSINSLLQEGIMYIYLVLRAISQKITIGDFSMYLNSISQFNNTLRIIIQGLIDLRQYNDYYLEFNNFISMKDEIDSNYLCLSNLNKNNINIEFKNVSYKYTGQENYALENINVKINSKEKIAIVGENGSGKSTFIKLLTRIYTPTKGEILLNGFNIQNIDPETYAKLISVVFQDFKLLSMSIQDNITFGNSTCNIDHINAIFKKVNISEKIQSLKNGIETYIYKDFSSNSFEPSGGEAQKIAISRCLYRDTPIIILDEPTAALDFRSEIEIYNQFNEFFIDKAVIFISHRLTVTKFTDKILVFKSGKLIEEGSHENLISQNGLYEELFHLQSKYYV